MEAHNLAELSQRRGGTYLQRNRESNLNNIYQTEAKRVLAICSAGMLRSPTVAWVLGNEPYNFNTRAAGTADEYALIPVEIGLILWADTIIVMDIGQKARVEGLYTKFMESHNLSPADNGLDILVWDIPDIHARRDPALVADIEELAKEYFTDGDKVNNALLV